MIKFEIDNENENAAIQIQGDDAEILTDLLKMFTISVDTLLMMCERIGATEEAVEIDFLKRGIS